MEEISREVFSLPFSLLSCDREIFDEIFSLLSDGIYCVVVFSLKYVEEERMKYRPVPWLASTATLVPWSAPVARVHPQTADHR